MPVLLTNLVGTYNILDGSVTTAKLADGAVTAAKIAAGAINASLIDFRTIGFFFDDFIGTAAVGNWAGITSAIAGKGGVAEVAKAAGNSNNIMDQSDVLNFAAAQNITIEMRAKITYTGNVSNGYGIGLTNNTTGIKTSDNTKLADQSIGFRLTADVTGNWYAECRDTASTASDTGVSEDTNFHLFKIVITSTSVKFYIDNNLVATITANITTQNLQVSIAATGGLVSNAAAVDVDYVLIYWTTRGT